MKVKHFTILELFVSIAVIGVMSSMILPSVSDARSKVLRTTCLNNQRMVSTATLSYIHDNNNYGPHDSKRWWNKGTRWQQHLVPQYMDEVRVGKPLKFLQCPKGESWKGKWGTNIAMNVFLAGRNTLTDHRQIKASSPTETVMLMDSYGKTRVIRARHMELFRLIEDYEKIRVARHDGTANVIFMDGSGKNKSFRFLSTKNNSDMIFWDIEK